MFTVITFLDATTQISAIIQIRTLSRTETSMVSQKFIEKQQQILRLTTPRLKRTPGAPFAQDDSREGGAPSCSLSAVH